MAYHKFKFYEQRKNDPKWRPYYLEAMRVREQARLTVQRRKEGQELEPFSGCDTGYFSFSVIGSLDIFTNK